MVNERAGLEMSRLKEELLATENLAIFSLKTAFSLRITGADRLEFLHGQLSNTVKGLKPGMMNQSLMLNHKGHALAQMTVCRRDDDLFVLVEDGAGELVQNQLQRHIIFDQVKLEPMAHLISSFSLQGRQAAELIKQDFGNVPDPGQFLQFSFASAKVLLHAARRSSAGGFDIHVLSKDADKLLGELGSKGALMVSQETAELARVSAGISKAATEAGEGVLPQEAGLEFAVSYTKGCYLGQEIMARIEARGNLRRRLQGLRLEQIPSLREISVAEKNVGQVGKVVLHPDLGGLALAVLRKDMDPQAQLMIGDVQARVVDLPFTGS